MGFGVISSILFAAPTLTVLKDQEPRIKAHNARVLARRSSARSGDVAPRGERTRQPNATASDEAAPALASTAPRPGSRPTAKRSTNRSTGGGRPGGAGNRPPSGGTKRR
jgi:preprotein translocase subunit SecF